MNYRNMAVIILLLSAAAGSWLLVASRDEPEPAGTVISSGHEGYYLVDATVKGIGPDGKYLYQIVAREISQDLQRDVIVLTDVKLTYSPELDVPWDMTAESGIIDSEERVLLQGNVRAKSGHDKVQASLRTSELEIDPEKYLAKTDKRVTIRVGARSLSATGMLAFLNEDRIELRSNVSGKFLP